MAGKKKVNKKKRDKKPKTTGQKVKRVLKYLLLLVLLIMLVCGGVVGYRLLKCKQEVDSLVDEKGRDAFTESSTSIVFDADGEILAELSSEKNSYYISSDEIPYMAKQIFVAIEDRKFFDHSGVDFSAVARAALAYIENNGEVTQGGSTITQQLARNIFLTHEVSMERKIKEILIAKKIEKEYTKDEILEFYINDIYFSNGFYGLEAASKGYFGKKAMELSLSQLAFVCSIPNSPTLYDPLVNMENTLKRRDRVLKQIYDLGYINQTTYNEALAEEIILSPDVKTVNNYAETFIRYSATIELMKMEGFEFKNSFSSDAEEEEYETAYDEKYSECNQLLFTSGYRIYTSIDMDMQELLQDTVDETLVESGTVDESGIYTFQGSATCVDNATGYVVAIVGGRSQSGYNGYTLNRAFQSFRQPGSSIKPILVYTPLFERGYTPDSIVKDSAIKNGPVNSPNVYSGSITLRHAIKTSKNTIAWKYFEEMGYNTCIDYLLKMGFTNIVEDDYTPAMSIGGMTYGVSTYEMAYAFATLQNNGVYRNPTCIKRIEDSFGNVVLENGKNETNSIQIYDPNATLMMSDTMKDVLISGTGKNYNIDNAVCAAKTGTTNDNKDSWLVGYSKYYTTAVWCGYDMPQEIEGNLLKAPGNIWHDYMEAIHTSLSIVDFDKYKTGSDKKPNSGENQSDEETTQAVSETTTPTETNAIYHETTSQQTTTQTETTTVDEEETTTDEKDTSEETSLEIITSTDQGITTTNGSEDGNEIFTTVPTIE